MEIEEDKIFDIADKITKHNFNSIWEKEGNAMLNLKKKEIAEEMFFKGIAYILYHLHNIQAIDIDNVKKKLEREI